MKNKTISILLAACAVLLVGAVAMLSITTHNLKDRIDVLSENLDGSVNALSDRVDALETGTGEADNVPIDPATVLAEIGDEQLTYQQIYDGVMKNSFMFEGMFDLTNQSVLNDMILQELHDTIERRVLSKMVEGLSITLDEQALKDEVAAQYDEIFNYYFEDIKTTGADDADAKTQAENLMNEYGMDLKSIEDNVRFEQLQDAVRESVAAPLIEALTTEDALKAAFDQGVSDAKARYEQESGSFEFEMYYFNAPIFYVPEGYRAVKHIFLGFDSDAAERMPGILEELHNPETEADRVAELTVQRDEIMAKYAKKIEEIRSAIDEGQDFDRLIEAYGEDEGMTQEDIKESGYYVKNGSDFWDADFQTAALALAAPGDVSGPTVSSVGIHFIKYLGDVPSGAVPFESARNAIGAEVTQNAMDEAYQNAYDEWSKKLGVQLHDDILKSQAEDVDDEE